METPDATYEDQAADTTSLDHHRMTDPTIPQATSLTFTARMELVDTTTHGAPANRADVEGAPCGQQQQIPQFDLLNYAASGCHLDCVLAPMSAPSLGRGSVGDWTSPQGYETY